MEKTGYIEMRITGIKGNLELSPDNYNIREIISILENAENLLYKTFSIRAIEKQHSETGKIAKTSLKFVKLIDYEPPYDEKYVTSLGKRQKIVACQSRC